MEGAPLGGEAFEGGDPPLEGVVGAGVEGGGTLSEESSAWSPTGEPTIKNLCF